MKSPAIAAIVALAAVTPSAAQSPVAIVEEVRGKANVEFMDYVAPGKVIKLGADGVVVLGYMTSCWRETIRGGVAVVGEKESRTSLGEVSREKVGCDAKQAELSDREAARSAATTFRSVGPGKSAPVARVALVYSVSPVFELPQPGRLVIERNDMPGQPVEADVTQKQLVKGRFFDLATTRQWLAPGGTYTATLGSRKVAFRIDLLAHHDGGPLVGRLVRF